MDIACPRCGEPWDLDTFHDVAEEQEISLRQALARFRAKGCAGTGWALQCEPNDSLRAQAAGALFDILGDDVDGIAASLEDFGL